MSRIKANWRRLAVMLGAAKRAGAHWRRVERWESPALSASVLAAAVALAFWPRLTVPALLAAVVRSAWKARPARAGRPLAMAHDPEEVVEEEAAELEAARSANPYTLLKRRVDRLQSVALTAQVGLASRGFGFDPLRCSVWGGVPISMAIGGEITASIA